MLALLVFLLYLPAFWLWRKDRHSLSLALIIIAGLAIRIYCASDPFLHPWDERYHALVARNLSHHFLTPTLYEHPILPYDHTNWTANHIWLHKQPMALWFMAISVKLFGATGFAVRIPSILFSTIGIVLISDLAKSLYSKNVAIISAFLFSIHGQLIELASGRTDTDHIDVCFMFFILLAVWLAKIAFQQNKRTIHLLCGVAIGSAILAKWLPALVVLPVWFLFGLKYGRTYGQMILPVILVCLTTFIVALPWQWYIFHAFPAEAKWEADYNTQHFFIALEGHDGKWFYYIEHLGIQYGEAVYLPVIWFIYRAFSKRKIEDFVILTWFLLPFIFYSIAATKMLAYTLITAPAIFIITAVAVMQCVDYAQAYRNYRFVFLLLIAVFLLLPFRYSIERVKPFASKAEDKARLQKLQLLHSQIKHPERTVVFNCEYPIELMFYSGCTAYSISPDSVAIEKFKAGGWEVR